MTIEEQNYQTYLEVIQKLDPELFLIKMALDETGINPMLIPQIIRVLGNLSLGTGWGKIQIFMENGLISQIKGEESVLIQQEVILDKPYSK